MVEIRTFEGTPRELSDFVLSVWRGSYSGKMAFPIWTPEYFAWQLDWNSPDARDQVLAAWVDGELAAVLVGWKFNCRRGDSVVPAVLSSWLSVRPEFRGRGVVKAFKAEQDARMRRQGDSLVFAYRYFGSEHSLSKGPTPAQLASGQWESRRAGFWVRILDPRRAAQWYRNPWQRRLTLAGAPFTLSPRPLRDGDGIRDFESADALPLARLLQARSASLALTIEWDADSLERHCSGFGRALVAEVQGQPAGLVSWHVLRFQGATEEPVGVFDLIAIERLPRRRQRIILEAALAEMKRQGVVLALKLRTGDCSPWAMLGTGFIPWFADSHETMHAASGGLTPVLNRPHHVLWR